MTLNSKIRVIGESPHSFTNREIELVMPVNTVKLEKMVAAPRIRKTRADVVAVSVMMVLKSRRLSFRLAARLGRILMNT